MNRHERRRSAAERRHNRFVQDYVHHLPEVGPEVLGRPGVVHAVFYHDDDCKIYGAKEMELSACTCQPYTKFFAEPKRS
jgi:hypothetical protein